MQLIVLDANNTQQIIIAKGLEAVTDASATIGQTGAPQTALAANQLRSGWIMQNCGANPMLVNEMGAPAAVGAGSFIVAPGAFFPPADFPVSTKQISIAGTTGDAFTLREW